MATAVVPKTKLTGGSFLIEEHHIDQVFTVEDLSDEHQQIADLTRQAGKDILITGSRTLWNDLLAHDLIDEIHLMIGNVVLGAGIPIFVGKPPASLWLVEVRSWRDSDNILVRYEVRHTSV